MKNLLLVAFLIILSGCSSWQKDPELSRVEKLIASTLPLPLSYVLECSKYDEVEIAVHGALINARISREKDLSDICVFVADIAINKISSKIDLSKAECNKTIKDVTRLGLVQACDKVEMKKAYYL